MNLASLSTSGYPGLLIHPETRPRTPINCGTRVNLPWLFSSSCHSSWTFLVITAYTPPAPGSRHASNVSPCQPGQILKENR
jgi:hypothetical protein